MEKEEGSLNINHTLYKTRISRRFSGRKPYMPVQPGKISSFIPGTVTEVMVTEGDQVNAGDDVVVLDAMKMQNRIKSHISGRVIAVNVRRGDRVAKGAILVEIA